MSDKSEKMPRNDEPAFPFTELNGNGDPYQAFPGMRLRDYFAAKALQGLSTLEISVKDTVECAYVMADAMMAEREK